MPKVPVLGLVRQSYGDVVENWRGLVRIGAIWFFVLCALLTGTGASLLLAGGIFAWLAMIAVAVTWHRHVLQGAPLAGWMAGLDVGAIRYAGRSLVCSAVALAIAVVIGGVIGVATALTGTGLDPEQIVRSPSVGVTVVVGVLSMAYVLARLQLVLPAAAIGDRETGFVRAWRLTKSNGWRLALGIVLVAAPIGLAKVMLSDFIIELAMDKESIGARGISAMITSAGDLLTAALLAAFLSRSYLFFCQRGAAGAA